MSIIPYRPFVMNKWVDDLFENLFNRSLGGFDSKEVMFSQPSVNVLEEAQEYIVEVAAPGLTKEDFKVEIENGYLTIRAQKEQKEEEERENGKYTRREFNFTRFQRSFHLPETVNAESIAAQYENGILKVRLPKVEVAPKEAVKTIEIK
jgi:HSP20 family protein